jgi:hypothetical protein
MKTKCIVFYLILFCVFSYRYIAGAQSITFNLSPHFFADNTEMVSPYIKTETIMGSSLKTYFSFRQSERLTLNLGVYGIFYYGEEDFISDVKPLASYLYSLNDVFTFRMGSLDNENRHNMLDALLKETLGYTRQIDYGFQLGARNRYADLDLWINWNLLNTPEHMEYLDGGINLFVYLSNFILNLQRYWTHHGGQLYQVGDTTNNYSLALGIEHFFELESRALQKIGGRLSYLAYDEVGTLTSYIGNGVLAELYMFVHSFKLYFDYWMGNDFLTEEGNPLYRHDAWIFCGVRSETKISRIVDFVFEIRTHFFLDTGKSGVQGRLEMKSTFGYTVKK